MAVSVAFKVTGTWLTTILVGLTEMTTLKLWTTWVAVMLAVL
jgi:uncharacterized membrane protein